MTTTKRSKSLPRNRPQSSLPKFKCSFRFGWNGRPTASVDGQKHPARDRRSMSLYRLPWP
jgi:hypothetical protein